MVIHTVKGFSTVSEAEVDVFLELPCFIHDLIIVGNLIFGASASAKPRLHIWKFSIHMLLRPSLKDFDYHPYIHYNMIYSSQNMDTITDRLIDKVYIYIYIYIYMEYI